MTASVSSIPKRAGAAVFLTSAALIAYQIVLVKQFSLLYWHHFAYFIISIALLGFGASGTCIFLLRKRLAPHLQSVLFLCPLFVLLAVWANIPLMRLAAFNPLMLVWQTREILRLFSLCLLLFVPFFAGAFVIGLSFTIAPDRIHRIYFANLTGSALGCFIILPTFRQAGPYELTLIVTLAGGGASAIVGRNWRQRTVAAVAALLAIAAYSVCLRYVPLEMSQFKDLAQADAPTEGSLRRRQYRGRHHSLPRQPRRAVLHGLSNRFAGV